MNTISNISSIRMLVLIAYNLSCSFLYTTVVLSVITAISCVCDGRADCYEHIP